VKFRRISPRRVWAGILSEIYKIEKKRTRNPKNTVDGRGRKRRF